MFHEPEGFEVHTDINTPEMETRFTIEEALEAYRHQRLALRFAGDKGMEHLSEDPFKAETQIKSLLSQGYKLRQDTQGAFYLSRGLLGGMMAETPIAALEKKLERKPEGKLSVFITYQWAQKEIAIAVHKAFEDNGFLVIRDEDTLHNGVYIQDFMKIITHPKLDYVLPIISASYLKSKNCMYEVNQIMRRHHWESSLLPYVVTQDGSANAHIYSGVASYEDYWQEQLIQPEGVRNKQLFENILRNIRPFTTAITTRIQIPERELIDSGYQALFETVSQREAAREGARFREIEELLRLAQKQEKIRKHEEALKNFELVLQKVEAILHLEDIDSIAAKVYGAYGEYLLRRGKKDEGQEKLEIAAEFGYKPANPSEDPSATLSKLRLEPSSSSPANVFIAQKEELELKLKAEAEAKLKKEEEHQAQLIKAEEVRQAEAKRKTELEAQQKAEATRKEEEKLKVEAKGKAELEQAKKSSASNVIPFTPAFCATPSTVNPGDVSKFLGLVARGEQDQAEELLKTNRGLLLASGTVRDLSGRTFEGITGLQYATWALDRHMWKMLLKYMSSDQAASQLREEGSWVKTHGMHAGMPGGPLAKLCTAYDSYAGSGYSAEHWQKQIGGAQLLLPVHVINEYCRGDRPFYPCPKFEELILPRTQKIDEGEWFSALYNGGRMGEKFAVYRGSAGDAGARAGIGSWKSDGTAVAQLTKTRVQELDVLLTQLGLDQQVSPRQRKGAS